MASEPKPKSKNARPQAEPAERDKAYRLNPKQREMTMLYIETGKKEPSYEAVYGRGNYSDRAFTQRVKKAFNHPGVVALVKELQQAHVERHNVTVDSLLDELEEARRLARVVVEPKTMVNATMGKAQILGLDGRQHDPKNRDPEPATPVTPVFQVKDAKAEVRTKNARPQPE